jgi:phosphoribosylformylglycinamidine synthase
VAACHDCSVGGLVAAVAEMAIGGTMGARLVLGDVPVLGDAAAGGWSPSQRDLAIAFTETPGRFVCEVPAAAAERFAAVVKDVPWAWIGSVTAEPRLEIVPTTGGAAAAIPVDRLARAWRGGV